MTSILHTTQDGVLRIQLNKPKRHNALDRDMVIRLATLFQTASDDPHLKAVVLEAQGPSFCSGADLQWLQAAQHLSVQDNQEDAEWIGHMLYTLDHMTHPTVALVQGSAHGGGLGLIACCDWVLSHARASFSMPEIRLGLLPATIAPFMARAIGLRRTRYALLSAAPFSAQAAMTYGLVHELAADDAAFAAQSDRIVSHLAHTSLPTQQAYSTLSQLASQPIGPDLLLETAKLLAELRITPEAQARMAAFLKKQSTPP